MPWGRIYFRYAIQHPVVQRTWNYCIYHLGINQPRASGNQSQAQKTKYYHLLKSHNSSPRETAHSVQQSPLDPRAVTVRVARAKAIKQVSAQLSCLPVTKRLQWEPTLALHWCHGQEGLHQQWWAEEPAATPPLSWIWWGHQPAAGPVTSRDGVGIHKQIGLKGEVKGL